MSAAAAPAWEQTKENAAPLERGRNVASLGLRQTRLSQKELNDKIEYFEELVRPSEAPHVTEMDDDDPLAHWLAYIKFYQASFPSDTRDNFLLMERCVRALVKMEQYSNDDRFVGVCAKYADKTKDPGQVFKYLHQQKVGTFTALFWIAWAFVAEKDNDFPFAEQIFKKGISKNAQPLQMLKMRHSQFQRRMSRHWLNQSKTNDRLEDEYESDAPNRSRSTLGGLSRDRLRRNDRGRSRQQPSARPRGIANGLTDNTNRQQQSQSNNGGGASASFSIFVEQEGENGYLDQSFAENERRVIAKDAERKKENTLAAERWNRRGGLRGRDKTSSAKETSTSFAVFVDEECAAQHQQQEEEEERHLDRQRLARDDRTLREHGSEGMDEKLARDPLRYLRDPGQLDSEKAAAPKLPPEESRSAPPEKTKSERKSRTGFNKRLLKNQHGKEQCFEEARAASGNFKTTIGSENNFNLLHVLHKNDQSSQMDMEDDEDGSIDISMAESTSRSFQSAASCQQPFKLQRIGSKTEGRRLFMPNGSFEAGLNQTAVSNTSSAVNESDAVGVSTRKEEATINTKFAMRELSMMFSSPAFALDGRKQPRHSTASKINENSNEDAGNDSFGNLGDGIMLNNSICNTGLEESDQNSSFRSGGYAKSSAKLQSSVRKPETFQIFQDNENDKKPESQEKGDFAIFDDSENVEQAAPVHQKGSAGFGFQIYQDNGDESMTGQNVSRVHVSSLKSIASESDESSVGCFENGDTASFTEAVALFGGDGLEATQRQSNAASEGDTATLSLFNEIFSKEDQNLSPPSDSDEQNKPKTAAAGSFQIFVDNDAMSKETEEASRSSFDVSRSLDGDGAQRVSDAMQLHTAEYIVSHEHDVQMALRRVMTNSAISVDSRAPLSKLLISIGRTFHFPSISLPKQLRRKRTTLNTEVSVGKHTGMVHKELGRGAYGVIFLMNISTLEDKQEVAIKVQSPTGSLAWEHEVLQRLEMRFCRQSGRNDFPFPKPFSFVSLADGGIMSMSAASNSGLNLVDLSNFYKLKLGETVPEVIALHYTSIALRIIEELHWHGKILHCDVKPDNFVLSVSHSSSCEYGHVPFSDLTLVDFGRAIDLSQYTEDGEDDVRNVLFSGNAVSKDMQCVAMRSQRPWSYDIDTYGILGSAHVLLYGTHLEISIGRDGKWRPKTALKRYWQQDLWKEIFETLLNLDDLGTAIGSRSSSLRALRRKINAYLKSEGVEEKLLALLKRQAGMLPDSREKIN